MRKTPTFSEGMAASPHETASHIRSRHPRLAQLPGILLLAVFLLMSGCASQTVFQSNFDRFGTGIPPIGPEKVGTTAVDPLSDQYVHVASSHGNNVVITRADHVDPVPAAALQCKFAQFQGDGVYVLSTVLYMPTGTGAATIQFETFDQTVGDYGHGFLHIDLMPDNTLRIDDNDATKFGTFPRDQEFVLQVTLKINPAPTAHIVLAGAGASAELDYPILPPFVPLARQYGSVRLWMGTPWTGSFIASNVVVTYQ
jgi:hypothetical protein